MTEARMAPIFDGNFITSSDMLEDDDNNDSYSPIKAYLKGKTIFITGGLGFLGKLLIEKLLRCDVKRIYLLVRSKKGKSLEERLEKLIAEPIFTKLLSEKVEPFAKLSLIKGDMQEIDLGISSEHRASLIDEVEIVFHAAADVRFDESLKEATEINVRGTREMMLLSQRMLNLNVFIYVSTAFCTPGFDVRESFYKTHLDPDFMIKLVESLRPDDYEAFEAIARRFIQPYPNTYTYTKALSEQIVRKYGVNINVAIIRPAIITTTFIQPIAGYTDNLYGVNGVVTGAGVGVLRILHIDNKLKANIVPADFVVNATIALAWFTVLENNSNFTNPSSEDISDDKHFYHDFGDEKIKIYHCTVSNNNPVTWADVKEKTSKCGIKFPIKRALWIICYNTTKHYYLSQFLKIFYHFLPALIIDKALELNRKKPKLLKIYRKVNKFSEVLSFFTNNEWNFDDGNMKRLCNAMSQHDQKFFQCDLDEIEWWDFFKVYCAGLRRFICNETLDTLDDARRRYRRMEILHYLLMTLIYVTLAFTSYHVLKFYGFVDYGVSLITRIKATFINFDER